MGNGELVRVDAPGLPADWLNAWLAAIGVTVLLPNVKLSWTDDVIPHAVFWVEEGMDLAEALEVNLPSSAVLAEMAIAPEGPGGSLGQKLTDRELYRERARYARRQRDWTFACAYTDLVPEEKHGVLRDTRGQFNVGMEGKETLWKRVEKCLYCILNDQRSPKELIGSSLGLTRHTVRPIAPVNGLGFDPRRLPSAVDPAGFWPAVDPVVEFLAFFGIQLMPVRGDGRGPVQKPWLWTSLGRRKLVYGCWRPKVDLWAIDGLTDLMMRGPQSSSGTLFHAWYRVVRYRVRGSEKKVGYFSEPVG